MSISQTLTFNGTVAFSTPDISTLNSFTMQYSNFKVTDSSTNQTTTLNSLTMTCDLSTTGCTTTSDFVEPDGNVYRATSITITGDASNGFNGQMTFYDATYGSVTVTATNVTYGTCGKFPDGGTIGITDGAGDAASIIFAPAPACTYSGTYTDYSTNTTTNINGTTG